MSSSGLHVLRDLTTIFYENKSIFVIITLFYTLGIEPCIYGVHDTEVKEPPRVLPCSTLWLHGYGGSRWSCYDTMNSSTCCYAAIRHTEHILSFFVFAWLTWDLIESLMLSARQASADDRSKKLTNWVKNVNIVKFHDHIWNHHEKCIQISTNMPSIGLVIPEIACEMFAFWENKYNFAQ